MRIGFTTSFPVEVIFAAGHTPVDLNNLFIGGDPAARVDNAERKGWPRNVCAWIKGLHEVAFEGFDAIVGITGGDCSNTHSLMSALADQSVEVIPFGFPYNRNAATLDREIAKLEERFGVTRAQTEDAKRRLDAIRARLVELDRLTWQENRVTGGENHLWLVSASDFGGDPDRFERELGEFLTLAKQRQPQPAGPRLAVLGVPPILTDLYDVLHELGVQVVFNEVQRQFAMPGLMPDIVTQYLAFTYPYTVFARLDDIVPQLATRGVDGVLSYTQAFCHRQIDNLLLRKYIDRPFLSIEGDRPGLVDARTRLRLESFLDIIT
ncbi:MAG: 2-hydroxyacyl-CoA dehydratase [Candidatus Cloacimonetes bacterium]|nr:2-hydroxyacyl-CoA dehydratase [Candidatus Cloacimonadota bacterium]